MDKGLEKLYREDYQRLYTLVFRMTGSREESEDILQSAFLQACRAVDSFREDCSLSTWLYRILINATMSHFKRGRGLPVEEYCERKGIEQGEFYQEINRLPPVEDEVLNRRLYHSCLQMFMNCMPSKQRAVYTLRVILSLSVKETALIMECSESAVKTNLHRARSVAKSHFNGRCSLISPGAPCRCRSYAAYVAKKGNSRLLLDIEVVERGEQRALTEFKDEMAAIDSLYAGRLIKPSTYKAPLEELRRLREERELKLLGG